VFDDVVCVSALSENDADYEGDDDDYDDGDDDDDDDVRVTDLDDVSALITHSHTSAKVL